MIAGTEVPLFISEAKSFFRDMKISSITDNNNHLTLTSLPKNGIFSFLYPVHKTTK